MVVGTRELVVVVATNLVVVTRGEVVVVVVTTDAGVVVGSSLVAVVACADLLTLAACGTSSPTRAPDNGHSCLPGHGAYRSARLPNPADAGGKDSRDIGGFVGYE